MERPEPGELRPPSVPDAAALREIARGDALERLVGLGRRAAATDVAAAVLRAEAPEVVACTEGNGGLPAELGAIAIAQAEPLFVADAPATAPAELAGPLEAARLAALALVPLSADGAQVGTLLLGTHDAHEWHNADRNAITSCARAIEEHVERALEQIVRRRGAAERERRYRDVALEQTALQRVATAVARSNDPQGVYASVCHELTALVGVPMSAVSRFHDGVPPELLATEGIEHDPAEVLCSALWERGVSEAAECYRHGETIHMDDTHAVDTADARRYAAYGIRSLVGAPIFVGGELWGAVTVGSPHPNAVPPDNTRRLERFAELVALAVANAESRALLAEQASTDALTGLANHRRFHEELHQECANAKRHGWPLATVVLDVDHFKHVNDALGHLAGDEVLRSVAATLRAEVREGETVARLGGDEFAVLLPGTDADGAETFARRVRECLAEHPALAINHITISAGVADLDHAEDGESLVRLADAALYWAKEHGRNAVWRYTPDVIVSLSARERAERLARSQALTALRALARAQDLRDPSTRRHAERVACLAQQIAERLGWDEDDRVRLGEAALLHDIGKIAIADELLHKPAALTDAEYATIKTHAALGAEIVSEALDPEQVRWVLHHHERWDGDGYPDGLWGEDVPIGALIIAVADAYDVMTTARHYRRPVDRAAALAECRRERWRQFCPEAVRALHEVLGARAEIEAA